MLWRRSSMRFSGHALTNKSQRLNHAVCARNNTGPHSTSTRARCHAVVHRSVGFVVDSTLLEHEHSACQWRLCDVRLTKHCMFHGFGHYFIGWHFHYGLQCNIDDEQRGVDNHRSARRFRFCVLVCCCLLLLCCCLCFSLLYCLFDSFSVCVVACCLLLVCGVVCCLLLVAVCCFSFGLCLCLKSCASVVGSAVVADRFLICCCVLLCLSVL